MITIVLLISFILDGFISTIVPLNSIFLPFFSIVALIIMYPYFNDNNKKFFKYCAIYGFMVDLVYTDTTFLSMFIYLGIGFLIVLFNYVLSHNIFLNLLLLIIGIISYRFLTYLFYLISMNGNFVLMDFIKSIYSSLIINIIYMFILYIITNIISKKFKILKSK